MATVKPESAFKREKELLELYRSDPYLAAHDLLVWEGKPVELQWYQVKVLESLFKGTPFVMLIMSRGLGKTWLLAIYLILTAVLWPYQRLGIVGPSYRQSKFLFGYITQFIEESPYLQACLKDKPRRGNDMCEVSFKTSNIKALPLGDGEKIRGARFYRLVVDEAAYVDREIFETVIIPFLSVGKNNQLVLSSTSSYQFNWLYKYYLDWYERSKKDPNRYAVHVHNFMDADHVDRNTIEMSIRNMPRSIFAMEYLSLWVSDTEGFFPASLIESAKSASVQPELYGTQGASYVMGIDPGDTIGAITIVKVGPPHKVVYTQQYQDYGWHQFVEEIWKLRQRFNIVKIGLDTKGGGSTVRELLRRGGSFTVGDQEIHIKPIITPDDNKYVGQLNGADRILMMVEFSKVKEMNDTNFYLKAALENKEIVFPTHPRKAQKGVDITDLEEFYDKEFEFGLYHELRMVSATETKTQYLHFDVPKGQRKDRYSSLLIAVRALREYLQSDMQSNRASNLAVGSFVNFRL